MKTRKLPLLFLAVAALVPAALADPPQNTAATPPQFIMPMSAGVDEVVKLTKAGVNESVVLTYVQNAPVAYRPSADEIITLRSDGVSDKVLAAMLQRGGEVREQMAQSQPQYQYTPPAPVVAQPATPAPVMAQPAVNYVPDQQPVTYAQAPDSYPYYGSSVVYIGGGYPYYPYYGCYGYPFYRGYCGPRFFAPGRFGGGFGGRFGGHFGGSGGGRIGGGGFRRGR